MKRLSKRLSILLLAALISFSVIPPDVARAEFTTTPMVAAGYYHSLALKSDGTVWTWGEHKLVPEQVKGPNGEG